MKIVAVLTLFSGLGLAGFATMQAQAYVSRIQEEQTVVQEVPTEQVVVFAHDLPRGHLIAQDDLTTVEYVAGQMRVEVAGESAIGQYTTRPVSAGQPTVVTALSVDEVPLQGEFVRVRRGTESVWTCIRFCGDPS